jgi:Rrf2 family transcriptional regulator, cysteine metabolism repressor
VLTSSIKGKYGLSILFELALRSDDIPVQVKELSKSRDVPHTYLEQILVSLRHAGFVKSFRGARGGYALAKPPSAIIVSDVLKTLEGPLSLSEDYCGCSTLKRLWSDVESSIETVLSVSLEGLINDKHKSEKMLTYTI